MFARRFSSPSAFGPRTRSLVSVRRGGERERGGVVGQRACIRVARDAPRLGAFVAPAARARRRMAVAAKRGTARKEKKRASSETRRLRLGARGVRADATEMRTFSRVLPPPSDANPRAARFAVRNPPFARREECPLARAVVRRFSKYRPSLPHQLAEAEDSPRPFCRLAFRVAFQSRRRASEKTKKKLTPD